MTSSVYGSRVESLCFVETYREVDGLSSPRMPLAEAEAGSDVAQCLLTAFAVVVPCQLFFCHIGRLVLLWCLP
jgi:hypothetical protein